LALKQKGLKGWGAGMHCLPPSEFAGKTDRLFPGYVRYRTAHPYPSPQNIDMFNGCTAPFFLNRHV
jgi:hypothetical protein